MSRISSSKIKNFPQINAFTPTKSEENVAIFIYKYILSQAADTSYFGILQSIMERGTSNYPLAMKSRDLLISNIYKYIKLNKYRIVIKDNIIYEYRYFVYSHDENYILHLNSFNIEVIKIIPITNNLIEYDVICNFYKII